ncbi:amidase [Herbaspirillum sp. WKF16]|uniref:amidase n=1 Tax=Herbaspirillum sp. WKF16 TaxID=3028312 RepID=UPI0023A9D235|nr:amidase [Herbaspirillum sp. WKF16]WDZ94519.1 amidase [Herbaspirillum sp. WKF16]
MSTSQQDHGAQASPLAAAIAAAERIDGLLKSFVFRPAAYAAPVDATGPLAGIPVAVKDLIDTADMPTAYGSKVFEGRQPGKDAWIVAKLRAAGAVIFGKTVTTEFAWRDPGATVNPWNTAHTPGGSSSGSAAAVGAGIVDIALGTQTVGSIIRPAAYCGACGYKPTYGLIPTEGTHELAGSLDHLGFITSSVYWAAVAHAVIARDGKVAPPASPNAFAAGVKPRKLGVYRSSKWPGVQAEVQRNFDGAVRRLEAHGVQCVPVELGADIAELHTLINGILAYEARAAIAGEIAGRESLAGQNIRELIAIGAGISQAQHLEMLARLAALRGARDQAFGDLDAIVTITSPTTALPGLEKTGDAIFCTPATLLGLPAVTVPSGFSDDFLPFGLQLIGRGDQDQALLDTAQWVSTILPASRPAALA